MLKLLFLAMLATAPVPAQAAETVIPIREVVLTSGTPRYVIDLMIDGRRIQAGLDTGSTGLRVLARALPATQGGASTVYSYGSGVELRGVSATHVLGFGNRHGPAPVMRIEAIGCIARRPLCPAAHADVATYGIQGDGLPGEGFAAIIGIGLKPDRIGNPFVAMGVRRWLVELPRRGVGPGRLVLDPDPAALARYRGLSLSGDGNNVDACLTAPGQAPICGPAHFDSGAPGLRISAAAPGPRWPLGTQVRIQLAGEGGPEMSLRVGDRPNGGGMLMLPRPGLRGPMLSLGNAPYFRWSVLYDAEARQIGLAERR